MASYIQKMMAAAEATGLSFDQGRKILHGSYNGYSFAFPAMPNNARYCTVRFHATRDGQMLTAAEGKEIAKESNKLVQFVKPAGSAPCSFMVKLEKDEQGTAQKLAAALTYLTDAFAARGYVNTCESCRQAVDTEAYAVGNGLRFLCPEKGGPAVLSESR